MKLGGVRLSSNVEDRRGSGGRRGRGGVALSGGVVVVIVIVGALMGKDPGEIVSDLDRANRSAQRSEARDARRTSSGASGGAASGANDPSKVFVSKVLATTEDAWAEQFARHASGRRYAAPTLVLFRDSVSSACGHQSAAVGPFYCPPDRKAFLDLTFFDDLSRRFGAPGDFAQAYVVAHEIGHHVQTIAPSAGAARGRKERGADGSGVRSELQADCYAGVWGAWAKRNGILDVGDIDEALKAAQAIGDDTLQRRGGGKVRPESFSHGTSAQRAKWFKHGMTTGDMRACDTFSVTSL